MHWSVFLAEVRLDVTDRSRMSRTTTPVKAFNEDEDDIPPPTVFVIPQNMLLTQVLASDTEEDLLNCFQKLKGFLEKAAKDTAVNDLLVSRGVKKRKQPTDIPRKEFLARCREHREENIMMWSREVRKAYQECLTLIEAQEKANKK